MVFRVELERFKEAVDRWIGEETVAVASREGRTIVTARNATNDLLVVSVTGKPASEVEAHLTGQGFFVVPGEWVGQTAVPLEACDEPAPYAVAIAYRSAESIPGLWMDAFPYEPTQSEALKTMFDEFQRNGELDAEVGFEEFLRHATPNVVILSPSDLSRFARAHLAEAAPSDA